MALELGWRGENKAARAVLIIIEYIHQNPCYLVNHIGQRGFTSVSRPTWGQKLNLTFPWLFKEADGNADFSIVDNAEVPTRARARRGARARAREEFCIVHNRKAAM